MVTLRITCGTGHNTPSSLQLYGSQAWDLSLTAITSFFISWRKSIRRLLKLPRQTHCALLHLICDDIHVSYHMYSRCITFFKSVFNSDNSIVKYCAKLAMSGSRSVMSNNLSVLSKVIKCTRYDLSIKSFNVVYPEKESDIIQRQCCTRHVTYEAYQSDYESTWYL